jgi:hypothetical protein
MQLLFFHNIYLLICTPFADLLSCHKTLTELRWLPWLVKEAAALGTCKKSVINLSGSIGECLFTLDISR